MPKLETMNAMPGSQTRKVSGINGIALTKLDVLDGLPELQVCTGYEANGTLITEFPADLRQLAGATPRYETLDQFKATVKADRAKWAEVVKAVGATID